jgi:phosphatidylinositol glycan class M
VQDRYFAVKYTDVDYVVFSDAARFMSTGSSPYLRLTYRYTPLLAALLTPNVVLGEWWGKALFASCDLAVGLMIIRLLRKHSLALPLACAWLLNPIVVNVSTRGNAEGFVAIWAVASLFAFEHRRYTAAAVLLGIATHVKIYPVVYGIPMALSLLRGCQSSENYPAATSLSPFARRFLQAAAFGAGKCLDRWCCFQSSLPLTA